MNQNHSEGSLVLMHIKSKTGVPDWQADLPQVGESEAYPCHLTAPPFSAGRRMGRGVGRPPTPNHTAQHFPQCFCFHAMGATRCLFPPKCQGRGNVAMAGQPLPTAPLPWEGSGQPDPNCPSCTHSNYFKQIIAIGQYFPNLHDFKYHRGCLIKT